MIWLTAPSPARACVIAFACSVASLVPSAVGQAQAPAGAGKAAPAEAKAASAAAKEDAGKGTKAADARKGGAPNAGDPAAPAPEKPPVLMPQRRESFDLLPEHAERFKKHLPKTFAKLSARDPVHIVALGDSVVDMYLYDDSNADWLHAYPAMFAKQLAAQFFYPGGVRIIAPRPGKAAKDRPLRGPEITVRNLGRGGKTMIHAMQTITTQAFENQPDLVMVSFGINDATMGLGLATYARALQEVIDTVRSKGAEIMLLGPTMTVDEPPEENMAATRPYSAAMREIAEESSVFFCDLGDLSALVSIPPEKTAPEQIFDETVRQYRRFFNHGTMVDFIHPRPEMHAILGKKIYRELTEGPRAEMITVSNALADLESAQKFVLSFQVKNTSKEDARCVVLPMVVPAWKPQEATPEVEVKAGSTTELKVTYTRRGEARDVLPLAPHEPFLLLPMFVSSAGGTRILELRAEARPVALLWKTDTLYNQEGDFTLEHLLVNNSGAEAKVRWSAEWMGQTRAGDATLAAGAKEPLAFKFNLPAGDAPFRQRQPMTLKIASGAMDLTFARSIEIARNIGLKQPVLLTPASANSASPAAGAGGPAVRLRFDADAKSLYATYEVANITLEDSDTPQGALGVEMSIDARSFGKRLGFGATDALRLNAKAADGPCTVANPPPWAWGTGYGALYDPAHMKATLSSGALGVRRVNITIPRPYLYLHEWALGNGNSQVGVNTRIMFWRGPREGAPQGDFPSDLFFSLVSNYHHRDDAEGLAVLELTEKPTQRWTVIPQ